MFTPEQIGQLEDTFNEALARFELLELAPITLTREQRVEFDMLGGMLSRMRDKLNMAAQ